MDSDVLNKKFINALNKCSERYNSIKENYPQSLTWFKNFVTATLIMSVERMIELENEEGSRKIQDALMDYYADEIEERWNELQEFGIRESITRILREESKAQKKLMGLIDEFGLNQAAKMLGVSMTKLVQLSNLPINSILANQLLIENMFNGNLPRKYNHFNIYYAGDGVVGWYCNISTGHFAPEIIEQISVMATPFWDGGQYTPVEIDWFSLLDDKLNTIIEEEGAGDYYKELKHQTSFENVEELFNWYKEFYLPEVYNMVMDELLPIVHSDIDDRLN
jgi:hypothetical protein